VELDLTAADALRELTEDLEDRGVVFAMARVKQDLRVQLARGGLLGIIDEDRMYPTLPVAVEAFEAWRDHR
jgi:SulP family sulfate permease